MGVKLRPFEKFAFYYDSFMAEMVNYKHWVDYTWEIWRRGKKEVKTVLDIACGTGIPTFLLLEKGYAVTGLDSSPEMLSVLKKKLGEKNLAEKKLKIVLADMKNFRLAEKFDAAVSFYDSINYLLTEEDLKSCFRSVFFALREGGIFTFDINTIFCLEEIWDNQSFWRESKELLTFWQNEYDKEKRISTLYLKCWVKGPNRTYLATFEERHQERGYALEKIEELLKAVGFFEVKFYRHLTFEKPYHETSRVMVVAIKR